MDYKAHDIVFNRFIELFSEKKGEIETEEEDFRSFHDFGYYLSRFYECPSLDDISCLESISRKSSNIDFDNILTIGYRKKMVDFLMTLEYSDDVLVVLSYIFYLFNINKHEFVVRFSDDGIIPILVGLYTKFTEIRVKIVKLFCIMMISNVLQYQNMIFEFFFSDALKYCSILDPEMLEAGVNFLYYSSKYMLKLTESQITQIIRAVTVASTSHRDSIILVSFWTIHDLFLSFHNIRLELSQTSIVFNMLNLLERDNIEIVLLMIKIFNLMFTHDGIHIQVIPIELLIKSMVSLVYNNDNNQIRFDSIITLNKIMHYSYETYEIACKEDIFNLIDTLIVSGSMLCKKAATKLYIDTLYQCPPDFIDFIVDHKCFNSVIDISVEIEDSFTEQFANALCDALDKSKHLEEIISQSETLRDIIYSVNPTKINSLLK